MDHPNNFLNLVFHDTLTGGDDLALCAGFERGEWRNEQFADHLMEWIPEFALSHSELNGISHRNAINMAKKAAKIVYQSDNYGKRGEFGELLLHIAIRQVYDTLPAISKIYYKSAVNETVKGFDAVHVVKSKGQLELWIGETKFYQDLDRAIRDVCTEIVAHLETNYLRNEFLLIANKIDKEWPEADALNSLLNSNTSLDEVFSRACIPVLLTYDSKTVQISKASDSQYKQNLKIEMSNAFSKMRTRLEHSYKSKFNQSLPVTLHVIFVPLKDKKKLVDSLDLKLKALQS